MKLPLRIIKPDTVSVLVRPVELAGQRHLVLTALHPFDLEDRDKMPDETALWRTAAEALGEDAALDEGIPKPTGEVLLAGSCHAPGGRPVPAATVRLSIAGVDKSLTVFGNRYWGQGALDVPRPEPFLRQPLTWARAFGGDGFALNPDGKGVSPVKGPDGITRHPLPNVENPRHLVASPSDKPEPAGFAPLPANRPQRAAHAGTFDAAWRKQGWPGFPIDYDFSCLNAAPRDQLIDGWFKGDEQFVIEGVHPRRPVLASSLPGRKVRMFVAGGSGRDATFSEVLLLVDTVVFLPDGNLGVLVFRGSTPLFDKKKQDIGHLYVALEPLRAARPVEEHYAAFLAAIAPAPEQPAAPEPGETAPAPSLDAPPEDEKFTFRDPAADELDARLASAEQALKAGLARLGIDLEAAMAEAASREEALAASPALDLKEAEERLDRLIRELGIEPAGSEVPPPPDPSALAARTRTAMASLKERGLSTPELEAAMEDMERELDSLGGGKAAPAGATEPGPNASGGQGEAAPIKPTREWLLDAYARGRRDFSGLDLTGLDLAGTMLPDIKLSGAILAGASLRGADLRQADLRRIDATGADLSEADARGADLSEAILAAASLKAAKCAGCPLRNADLSQASAQRADFRQCGLAGATLAEADLSEALLAGADLSAAVLRQAKLGHAKLPGARLEGADLSGADLHGADLAGALASKADFSGALLAGASLAKAVLDGADLDRTDLSGADLSEVHAKGLSLHGATGEGARLTGASLENLRADAATALPRADFSHCRLPLAAFIGSDLARATFEEALLDESLFQECALTGTNFRHAVARGCRFLGCDLTGAGLVGANLLFGSLAGSVCHRTDLRGSNLFGLDVLHTEFSGADISGANVKRSRLEEMK